MMKDINAGSIPDWRETVKGAILNEKTFTRATFSRKAAMGDAPWVKVVVRPVLIKGQRLLQFAYSDGRKEMAKNYVFAEAVSKLDEALGLSFPHLHVQSLDGDIHVRVTRKGKPLVARGKPSKAGAAAPLEHNRSKQYPLPANQPDVFLTAIGIMDEEGRILPTMQAKYHQINEFLKIIEQVTPERENKTLRVLDCGSGSAWLTFAAYHYLNHVRGLNVSLIGIDANADVIGKSLEMRNQLGWDGLDFQVSAIRDFTPKEAPDMVMSLHACDTATDEAIAAGIRQGSSVILAAPCCQHELHHQLNAPLFRPVLRHGILRERMADLLTDSLRALVLRIMGYQTSVIEFVAAAHTPKNLMIRAEKKARPGHAEFVAEYRALKEYWGIEPAIEELAGDDLRRILSEGGHRRT